MRVAERERNPFAIGGRGAAWVKNIRAEPGVRLRIRGGTFSGRTRELGDGAERERARWIYCADPTQTVHSDKAPRAFGSG
jgi:F420H(2)-dependent quinone reductase